MSDRMFDAFWSHVSPRDFWIKIFPRLCNLTFFISLSIVSRKNKDLFHPEHLAFCQSIDIEDYVYHDENDYSDINNSKHIDRFRYLWLSTKNYTEIVERATSCRGRKFTKCNGAEDQTVKFCKTVRDQIDDDEHNDVLQESNMCKKLNNRVYRSMWLEFMKIIKHLNSIIWTQLRIVTCGQTFDPKSNLPIATYIQQAYENAMMKGHVLLAAPLSVHAPMSTVNFLTNAQMEKIEQIRSAENWYGNIFNQDIVNTLQAALHYGKLICGFRPIHLWSNKANCPWFIIRRNALCLYHFYYGIINDSIASVNTRLPLHDDREIDNAHTHTTAQSTYNTNALKHKILYFIGDFEHDRSIYMESEEYTS